MNSNEIMYYSTMIISWALVVLSLCLVPVISRRNVAFGIAIPENEYNNKFFAKLRRSYLSTVLILGLILGICCNLTLFRLEIGTATSVYIGGIILYLAIAMCLYFACHYKVKAYKQKSNWQIESTATAALRIEKNEKKHLSLWWFLSYPILIVSTVIATIVRYSTLPEQIPMNYDMYGNVSHYAAKSFSIFLYMPVMQLLIGLLLFGVFIATLHAKVQSAGGEISEGLKRDRRFKSITANFIFLIGLAVILDFSIVQLTMLGMISISLMPVLMIVFLAVISIATISLMLRVGQSGSRMRSGKTSVKSATAEADSKWIGGIFYFNKNDPSLFVEKRFGLGYTLNFGNPKSIVAIVLLALFIAATLLLPKIIK